VQSRHRVLPGGLLILPGDADAGGVEVGQSPEQFMVEGDAEGDRAEKPADAIVGQVIEFMPQGIVVEVLADSGDESMVIEGKGFLVGVGDFKHWDT
jgi:hypothetical protein